MIFYGNMTLAPLTVLETFAIPRELKKKAT
jgi:hypothetical protein